MGAVDVFETTVIFDGVEAGRVDFSEGVGRRNEGARLYQFVGEDALEGAFGGPFASEVFAHEALVVVSGEVGLVEFESAGLGEGFEGEFFSGLVVFGFVGVDGADGAPHNNINSERVRRCLFKVKYRT